MNRVFIVFLAMGLNALCAIDYDKYSDRWLKIVDVGGGAVYSSLSGENIKTNNTHGFASIDARFIRKSYLLIGIGLKAGYGVNSHSGSYANLVQDLRKKGSSTFADLGFKIGINLLPHSTPIFINYVLDVYSYYDNKNINRSINGNGIGIEAYGKNVVYSLDALIMSATYGFPGAKGDDKDDFNGFPFSHSLKTSDFGGYGVNASVKYMKEINQKRSFYVRLTGKYSNVKSAKYRGKVPDIASPTEFPKSSNLSVMAEVGLSFY